MKRALRRFLAVALCGSSLACADFSSPADPTGGAPDILVANPSFAADILPVLEKRCSIGGCHSLATSQGELSLTGESAYDALVNVVATQTNEFKRVLPFQPDSSWLVRLIAQDESKRLGYARMPLSSLPLTSNQIGTIVNWILQGAQRN